jgi:hypothetical protein
MCAIILMGFIHRLNFLIKTMCFGIWFYFRLYANGEAQNPNVLDPLVELISTLGRNKVGPRLLSSLWSGINF